MRREAAVILGAVGSVLVLAIQILLGTADVSTLGPAIETVLTTALPLIVGYATRGVVFARATVERHLESAPDLVSVLVRQHGADVAVRVLREALDRAERAITRP